MLHPIVSSHRPFLLLVLVFVTGAAASAGSLDLPPVERKLEPLQAFDNGRDLYSFGTAVALQGDVLLVGAPSDDGDSTAGLFDTGAVFVYELDRASRTWTEVQKILAPDAQSDDHFGFSVDLALGGPGAPDFMIVGAPGRTRDIAEEGKAYIFERVAGSWEYHSELFPEEMRRDSNFGYAVGIDLSLSVNSQTDDPLFTAVVSTPNNEKLGFIQQGSVHVYQYLGAPPAFVRTHEFFGFNPVPVVGDDIELGESAAIDGGLIVAGAPLYDGAAQAQGAVYVYGQGNNQPGGGFHWTYGVRLEASDPSNFDLMGQSVALDFPSMIVAAGVPFNDEVAAQSGAVYVFSLLATGLVHTEVQKLWPSDSQADGKFGTSLAMDGTLMVVGAPGEDANGGPGGAVYVFERTGGPDSWTEIAKISPSDALNGFLEFGSATTLDGGIAVAGLPQFANNTPGGAAYVLDGSGAIFADGFESGNTVSWSTTSP